VNNKVCATDLEWTHLCFFQSDVVFVFYLLLKEGYSCGNKRGQKNCHPTQNYLSGAEESLMALFPLESSVKIFIPFNFFDIMLPLFDDVKIISFFNKFKIIFMFFCDVVALFHYLRRPF
jgi:hypothetical protein